MARFVKVEKTWWEGSGEFDRVLELRQMGKVFEVREYHLGRLCKAPLPPFLPHSLSLIMYLPRALLKCKCLIKTLNVIIAHYHISPN